MPFLPSIGTIAVTELGDIFAGAAIATPVGTIGVTELADPPDVAGNFTASAVIALDELADLPDLVGGFTASASIAVAAGNDSPSISGLDTAFGAISITGGNDALAATGMFTASGAAALTEGRDATALAALFLASGSISLTAGNDSPALVGFYGELGSIAVTEGADTPSMAGSFLAPAAIGMVAGHSEFGDVPSFSGTFATSASMGITEGHDSFMVFSSGVEYHIYSNTGVGDPINYTTAIATTGLLEWTSSPLSYPGTWRFGVRAFNPVNGLEEENLDCSVTIILDAGGNDITNRPLPPQALRAFATAGGGIRVEWAYNTINPSPIPTGFHVYIGTGGTPSYGSPVATVSFQASIAGTFVANLSGLVNGTVYTIGVRAYNATAEEPNTNTVNVTAAAVGPTAVIDLSATAIV
jgi:hypothetical protein